MYLFKLTHVSLITLQAFIVMTSNAKRRMDNKRLEQDEKNLTGHSFETLQSSTIPAYNNAADWPVHT